MIRTALLSRWHVHANDYARQAKEHPHVEIVRVWDDDETRGRKWADELGVPFESSLATLLQDDTIDAVIVDTPTQLHKDVIIAAAKHGKHIFSEKVLAFTVADCEEIFSTVDENRVKLMLSLPRLTDPYYLYAQKAVDDQLLGKVNTIRCRLSHNGAVSTKENPNGWLPATFFDPVSCGGGALIDLGAHPIYLINRLAGQPKVVNATLSGILDLPVDDNSVVTVQYESGVIGIMEAGFSSGSSPFLLELYGTKGTLLIEDEQIRIRSEATGPTEWVIPNDVPDRIASPFAQWVKWIEEGEEPTITRQDILHLTLINEAARTSSETEQAVVIHQP
ncbi:Gfo/Idh/MocA family protein [Alicyclobacillus dauci]|uniref:Gfo/Idh/MocA family oxidoreductase n=1 Tax=Alicyclobacillus dauci TaxID=1475485 RepID=A0ABY6YXP6_9BACL|nr:Gfo/Idh/MocA family oxidoreductase [Alicyclobacillus dauci]WAH35167.1 Gfo/Idh/MocA family oxidoreductase [Alicyclobacillus dauci]